MNDLINSHYEELYHHGVKGQKWGVRRYQKKDGSLTPAGRKRYSDNGGIAGAIRNKQRSNAERDLNSARSGLRKVDSELKELEGYENNPSKLGKSKISSAIRRQQIKSLKSQKEALKALEKENVKTLRELDSIEKYQAEKRAAKVERKMAKVKIKELEKQYGNLEDQMTYGKKADTETNTKVEKQMNKFWR